MEVVPEKYKQSEIGFIPSDWTLKSIGEISRPVRGGSPRPAGSPKYFNGDYMPWLTVASLTNIPVSQLYVDTTEGFLTKEGTFFSRTLEKGTLIISNSGATLGVAKILAIKCCANDGIAALLEIDKGVDTLFLVYYINSLTKTLREVVATGNGQPNLNTDLIGNLLVPISTSKEEQTNIATTLSDADNYITHLEKLIVKKRLIKQGAMQKLLTPKVDWEEISLGNIGTISKGEQLNRSTLQESGTFPVMNGGILPSGYTNKWNQESETIIISEGGNSCGYINFMRTKFWQGGHCYSLKTNFNKYFLYQLLKFKEKEIMGLRVGSGLPNIQRNRLDTFTLFIPTIEEQIQIASILSEMDKEIELLEDQLSKAQGIKQGMMQQLLTGKIRLV